MVSESVWMFEQYWYPYELSSWLLVPTSPLIAPTDPFELPESIGAVQLVVVRRAVIPNTSQAKQRIYKPKRNIYVYDTSHGANCIPGILLPLVPAWLKVGGDNSRRIVLAVVRMN